MNYFRNQISPIVILIIFFSVSLFPVTQADPIKITGEKKIFGLGNLLATDISEDGKTLVSLGADAIYLWDVDTEKVIRKINKEPEQFRSIDLSPDAKTVLTSNYDGIATIRNMETGEIIRSFKTTRTAIFSPDASLVALTSVSNEIEIHSVSSGQKIYTLTGSRVPVCFAPDGKSLVTKYYNEIAAQWDLQTGKPMRFFEESVGSLLWSENFNSGKLDPDVLHSSPDNSFTIKPYSHPGSDYILSAELVKNGTASIEFPLEKPDAYITLRFQVFGTSIYFEGPNQEYLKTTNFEYDIYLDGEKIPAIIGTVGSIPNEKEGIWCKDTYHSDKIVQQGAKQHTCRMEIRNISAKNSPKPISVEINKISISTGSLKGSVMPGCFSISPDGEKLLTGVSYSDTSNTTGNPMNGLVMTWNFKTGEFLKNYSFLNSISNAAFAPDGKTLLAGPYMQGLNFQPLQQVDLNSGAVIQSVSEYVSGTSSIFFDNGSKVLMTTTGSVIKIFDTASFHELKKYEGHCGTVSWIYASKDGDKIMLNCRDGVFRLWDIKTDHLQAFHFDDLLNCEVLNISPDGSKVLFRANDYMERFHSIDFGNNNAVSHIDQMNVYSGNYPTFSPDGQLIYTAQSDSFGVFDAATYEFLHYLPNSSGNLKFAISPDSTLILYPGTGNKALLCDISNGSEFQSFRLPQGFGVSYLAFSPNVKECLTANSNTVYFWDIDNGNKTDTFTIPPEWDQITSVDYYKDSNQIIIGAKIGKIFILDRKTFSIQYELSGPFKSISTLVVSNQGAVVNIFSQTPSASLYSWKLTAGVEDFMLQ